MLHEGAGSAVVFDDSKPQMGLEIANSRQPDSGGSAGRSPAGRLKKALVVRAGLHAGHRIFGQSRISSTPAGATRASRVRAAALSMCRRGAGGSSLSK
jgi:hypothetical protein